MTSTLWVCVDCLMTDVNGEIPEDRDDRSPLPWSKWDDTREITLGLMKEEHSCDGSDPECGCESIEFSWRSCDGCGSHLGGSRQAYTFHEKEGAR